MKDDAKITSNIDNEKMNFTVKFYEFLDFQENQDFFNFKASFEAIAEASGIE